MTYNTRHVKEGVQTRASTGATGYRKVARQPEGMHARGGQPYKNAKSKGSADEALTELAGKFGLPPDLFLKGHKVSHLESSRKTIFKMSTVYSDCIICTAQQLIGTGLILLCSSLTDNGLNLTAEGYL